MQVCKLIVSRMVHQFMQPYLTSDLMLSLIVTKIFRLVILCYENGAAVNPAWTAVMNSGSETSDATFKFHSESWTFFLGERLF